MPLIRFRALPVRLLVLAAAAAAAPPFTATVRATDTLTLMTYNLHAGFPMGSNSGNYVVRSGDLARQAEVIASSGADVVALQEAHCEYALCEPRRQRTSGLNQPRLLAHLTGLGYAFGSTLDDVPSHPGNIRYLEWGTADTWTNNSEPHGEFGNALLSRFGFEGSPENFPLPGKKQQEQRAFLRAKLPGRPVVIYSTHLHHQGPATRALQMETLLRRATAEPSGTTVFILGDLNAADNSPEESVSALARRYGFHDLHELWARQRGSVPAPTFPADSPKVRIDYVWCNRPLPVEEARVVPSLASDHLPLLVRVRLEAP